MLALCHIRPPHSHPPTPPHIHPSFKISACKGRLTHFQSPFAVVYNDDEDLLLFNEEEGAACDKRQKIEDIISNCKAAQLNFQDPDFTKNLPDQMSKRPFEFMENPQLFSNIRPEGILQGSLGDCYLLSSISVLAENPFHITRLFQPKKVNEQGAYAIWVCESGFWKQVFVDDYFLVNQSSTPVYCRSKEGEVWPLLLEKAYAKCYGGYKKIEVGFSLDALRDLTGAPCQYIDLKSEQKACNEIRLALEKKYVLTASSKENSEDMVSRHCYAILDYKQVKNKQSQAVNFIKIRNPYGSIHYVEQQIDEVMVQNLGEALKQEGGILWLNMQEFRENFEVVSCNHVHAGYSNTSYTCRQPTQVLYVRAHKATHAYFSIILKHERFLKQNPGDKYLYPTQRIILARIGGKGELSCLEGAFGCKQACYIEQTLERGEYLIYAEIDAPGQQMKYPFSVSCYSQSPVSMTDYEKCLDPVSKDDLLQFLVMDHSLKHVQAFNQKFYDETNKGIQRLFGDSFGAAAIIYVNSSANQQLLETIEEFTCIENLIPYKFESKQALKVVVAPAESRVLLLKFGNLNNNSHKLQFRSKSNVVRSSLPPGQQGPGMNAVSDNDAQALAGLINKAISQGQPKKRSIGNKEINLSIYTLKHNEGIIMVYKNDTASVYKETITFTSLENLALQSQGQVKNRDVSVSVAPGATFWIKLNFVDPANKNAKFQSKFI